ncbi:MAG: pentapeptide repeat-containing protein [Bacteroidia bacterium]
MLKPYIEDQVFENIDYTILALTQGDYENCSFENCNFSAVDMSSIDFIDCTFTHCNMSMAIVNKTGFKTVSFNQCKVLGMRFDVCNPFLFAIKFNDCVLNHSSFFQLKAKATQFNTCTLHEVDFTEADLTSSLFDNCDLAGATFDRTLLEKVDFRTARNFALDPELNRIKKAKFSIGSVAGLLSKYNIDIS